MKDGSQRNLVGLVVKKAQELNQIRDLFAFVKSTSQHCLIRNVGATKHRFINLHVCHRAKQQCDVAVVERGRGAFKRDNAARDLLCVEYARVLLSPRIVFERRLGAHQQLDKRTFVAQLAFGIALLVFHITELVQVFYFAGWDVVRNLKHSCKEMIEETDQRRLAAKVQLQRLLFSARSKQSRSHLAKHVDVSAPEAVDRLLAIADDEKIRGPASLAQSQAFEQHALHVIRILKLVNEEEPVALGSSRDDFRLLQQ